MIGILRASLITRFIRSLKACNMTIDFLFCHSLPKTLLCLRPAYLSISQLCVPKLLKAMV